MRFDGKVVLVTGGSRGIGGGISRLFGRLGAKVAVNYARDEVAAGQLVAELMSGGTEAEAFRADVADYVEADALVGRVVEHLGTLDVLVNNAGINIGPASIFEMPPAVWNRVIATNLSSMYNVTRPAAIVMRERGGGAIVNIAFQRYYHRRRVRFGLRGQQGRCDGLHPLSRQGPGAVRHSRERDSTRGDGNGDD